MIDVLGMNKLLETFMLVDIKNAIRETYNNYSRKSFPDRDSKKLNA